jgi:hypothetical protein
MTRRSRGLWAIAFLGVAANSPLVCRASDAWEPYRFLLGDWVGDGSGGPGKGSGQFSFRLDLQDKVIVRKNHAVFPAAAGRPAVTHDDLMVIYRAEGGGPTKAIYFDNEGHVIQYTASFSADQKTLVFVSEPAPAAPRFRLSYSKGEEGTVGIKFEMAPPTLPDAFRTYLEGKARRGAEARK